MFRQWHIPNILCHNAFHISPYSPNHNVSYKLLLTRHRQICSTRNDFLCVNRKKDLKLQQYSLSTSKTGILPLPSISIINLPRLSSSHPIPSQHNVLTIGQGLYLSLRHIPSTLPSRSSQAKVTDTTPFDARRWAFEAQLAIISS